jgi:hypothetical protein
MRGVLLLVAQVGSDDPAVRRTAEEELAALRQEIDDGPSPGEVFGKRVAQILRDTADRLSGGEP